MVVQALLCAAAYAQALPVARPGLVAVVRITVDDREELDALTEAGFDISNVQGSEVTIYATWREVDRLRSAGYSPVQIAVNPRTDVFAQRGAGKVLGAYNTYNDMTAMLQGYASTYGPGAVSDICRLYSLGRSVQNRELWALVISDSPELEEDEPEFKYVSTMHGDEPVGTEMCLYFIDLVLTSYGTDPRITSLVDETAIWVVPMMNPDGHTLGSRYNAQGWDLNRSFPAYPDHFTGNLFDGEPLHDGGRPPEVAHVMQWTAQNRFVLSANFHTGALLVNYPYDDDGVGSWNDAPTPDDLLFENVSMHYSQHNPPMWNSPFFPNGISNGSLWYEIDGGMQDWNYRYASCNEVTIELSDSKWPPQSTLPSFWNDNRESMLSYLEAVHIGVRGVVTATNSGLPLSAKVSVAGNAHHVFTDPDVGDYHRMLLPGTYSLTFTAPGYAPRTVSNISVAASPATRVDITLDPLPYWADFNGDLVVNALDIQIVVNAALGLPVGYPCDLDGNGAVDAVDVQMVLNADLLL